MLCCGRFFSAFKPVDRFAGLHDAQLIAGDRFDILGIGLKELNLAGPLLLEQLLGCELRTLSLELRGQIISTAPRGIKREKPEGRHHKKNDHHHKPVQVVPDLRVITGSAFGL